VRNKRHDLNEFRIFLCPTSGSYLNWPINICTSDDIHITGVSVTHTINANVVSVSVLIIWWVCKSMQTNLEMKSTFSFTPFSVILLVTFIAEFTFHN
jgi:hypothetical protein